MKRITPLKLSLVALLIGVFSYPQWIFSARPAEFEFREIPVQIDVQTLHARQILGGPETSSLTWRGPKMAELLYQTVLNELAPEHRAIAPKIVSGVLKASLKHGMDPLFLLAMIKTETRFNPNAVGRHGEIGLMQILPRTAQWMAIRLDLKWTGPEALKDPEFNIRLGAAYVDFLRNRLGRAGLDYVSAYNMGAGNVFKLRAMLIVPAIYANKVMHNYRSLAHRLTVASAVKAEFRVSLAE
jgi:soluble lytic murein transglycosylase